MPGCALTRAGVTYKYDEDGADAASIPLSSYLGEAVACNFTRKGPSAAITEDDSDCRMMLAGIPTVDGLVGLDQISGPRVFFITLPVRMRRVTATWTRAIVLEETVPAGLALTVRKAEAGRLSGAVSRRFAAPGLAGARTGRCLLQSTQCIQRR